MSRKRPDNFEDDLSASDDDAPEEIGMSISKKQSLSQAQSFRDQERIFKDTEKERRRNRNEIFKLQKEKKLESINNRAQALPVDVLEAVSAKSAKSDDANDDVALKPDEDDAGSGGEADGDRLSDSGVEDDSNVNEDDYIPFNSSKHGNLNVVSVQNFASKNKSATEAAAEFRNNRLFGAQCTTRESAKQRRANRMKKRFKCT